MPKEPTRFNSHRCGFPSPKDPRPKQAGAKSCTADTVFVAGVPTHWWHHQTGTETFINSERCSPWSPCLTDTRSGTKVGKCSHPLVWTALVWDFCLCSSRAQLLLSNLNDMNYTLQDSSKQPRWWGGAVRVEEVGHTQKNKVNKKKRLRKFPPTLLKSRYHSRGGVCKVTRSVR